MVGIDNSDAMLSRAVHHANPGAGLSFTKGDLATFTAAQPADLLFSNAAPPLGAQPRDRPRPLAGQLRPGGQLAVQVPCNDDHPAYPLASVVANQHPEWFPHGAPALATASVLTPERYASILHALGASDQHVALRVYVHVMPSVANVADWLQGTTLNPFKLAATSPEAFEAFTREYRARLTALLGTPATDSAPAASTGDNYAFTFKRILLWARFASGPNR
ncbi:MAG: hypothetical protein R2706_15270 [Acidimicrobiales bacterium]